MKLVLPLLLVIHFFLFPQELKKDKSLEKILAIPDKEAIQSRIKFLADDKLLGRRPGTPGFQMAVDYVIDQFKQIGVEPKGDEGFLQKVVIRTGKVDTSKVVFEWNGKPLRFRKDMVVLPDMNNAQSSGEASIVFVGMGIYAPSIGHDDYAGIDVKGKVVLMLPEIPDNFSDAEKSHFTSMTLRAEVAASKGAVGAIAIVTNKTRYKTAVDGATKGVQGIVNKNGQVSARNSPVHPNLKFYAVGSDSCFRPMALNRKLGDILGQARVQSTTTFTEIVSYNIVGLIPGTDSQLKSEYVVHTAHLDHLGIRAKVKNDSIYNGAHDNASGVSCALEIAKLYKKAKLKRSVLIAIVTGEEMGLLGSTYFVSNPPVEKSKIVANINTDMPTLLAPLLSIEPLGAWNSSLMNEVVGAAKYLNLEIMPDHIPDQVRFTRSDQYSFIRGGIPALAIKYGLKSNDPSVDLKKLIDDWTKEHYHQPSDEYSVEKFDWDAAITYVKLNFLIGYQVANAKEKPKWNKGDFFGDTFGR